MKIIIKTEREKMKEEIRKEILKARQALSPADVSSKSEKIQAKIKALGLLDPARTIMSYLPFRNEVDTCALFDFLWEQGKTVVVPVCDVKNIALIPSCGSVPISIHCLIIASITVLSLPPLNER
jgi:5,10-methenyltetrahydrofolate synthetase